MPVVITYLKICDKIRFKVNIVQERLNVTARGGSVITHETHIREVPGPNSGAEQPD